MSNTCTIQTDRYLELCRADELLNLLHDALDSAQPYVDMYALDVTKRLVHAALDSWDVYRQFGIGLTPVAVDGAGLAAVESPAASDCAATEL